MLQGTGPVVEDVGWAKLALAKKRPPNSHWLMQKTERNIGKPSTMLNMRQALTPTAPTSSVKH